MTMLELAAVVVSLLGVWLTARRSLWSFPWGLASVALYAVIFYRARLYADALLQGIFAATLLYGLACWWRGRAGDGRVTVRRGRPGEWLAVTAAGALVALGLGDFLATRTDAAVPWIDAALLAASLAATWGSARRILEHWWIWIVADVVYVGVYVYKQLFATAGLYLLFVALAAYGLREWRASWRTAQAAATAPAG